MPVRNPAGGVGAGRARRRQARERSGCGARSSQGDVRSRAAGSRRRRRPRRDDGEKDQDTSRGLVPVSSSRRAIRGSAARLGNSSRAETLATNASPRAAPSSAARPKDGPHPQAVPARRVARVAQANGRSAVARLACATRFRCAAAARARAPGRGVRGRPRRPARAAGPARARRERGEETQRAFIGHARRGRRLSREPPGTMIGVLEFSRSWLVRSVTPVSRKRSLH